LNIADNRKTRLAFWKDKRPRGLKSRTTRKDNQPIIFNINTTQKRRHKLCQLK
jgi:uncharacterized membrane protein (UPF0127 family)